MKVADSFQIGLPVKANLGLNAGLKTHSSRNSLMTQTAIFVRMSVIPAQATWLWLVAMIIYLYALLVDIMTRSQEFATHQLFFKCFFHNRVCLWFYGVGPWSFHFQYNCHKYIHRLWFLYTLIHTYIDKSLDGFRCRLVVWNLLWLLLPSLLLLPCAAAGGCACADVAHRSTTLCRSSRSTMVTWTSHHMVVGCSPKNIQWEKI